MVNVVNTMVDGWEMQSCTDDFAGWCQRLRLCVNSKNIPHVVEGRLKLTLLHYV